MRVSVAVLAVLLTAAAATAQQSSEAVLRKEAGNLYLKERKYDEAREQYLAAAKADPAYADAHYNLGVVYFFRLKDYPRALYHFTRYAELRPNASDMDQVKALVLQALEKVEASERDAYARALHPGTVDALRAYVEAYPNSPYVEDARENMRLLREYEDAARQREQTLQKAYEEALASRNPEAMEAFLKLYPDAARADEARRLRDTWARRKEEDRKALEVALDAKTTEALQQFLAEHPDSLEAPRARAELDRLRTAEEAYRIAAEARSIPALEVFLATHADTPWEGEAQQLIETLRREEQEKRTKLAAEREAEEAFQVAAESRSIPALEGFLAAHSGTPREAEARQLIGDLRREEQEKRTKLAAEEAFQVAAESRSIPALEGFLAAHSGTPREAEARQLIGALRREEQEKRTKLAAEREAEEAFRVAAESRSISTLEGFVAAHSGTPREAEARQLIETLRREEQERRVSEAAEREAAEARARADAERAAQVAERSPRNKLERDWLAAQQESTRDAYERFLRAHPDGEEAEAARTLLEELEETDEESAERLSRSKRKALNRYRMMLQDE